MTTRMWTRPDRMRPISMRMTKIRTRLRFQVSCFFLIVILLQTGLTQPNSFCSFLYSHLVGGGRDLETVSKFGKIATKTTGNAAVRTVTAPAAPPKTQPGGTSLLAANNRSSIANSPLLNQRLPSVKLQPGKD